MRISLSGRSGIALALGAALLAPPAARAAAPSITPDMPAEVKSWRETILQPADYARLVEAWRAYAEAHPASAVAQVQIARAMRYAGQGTPDEREVLVRKALAMNASCPEALESLATIELSMRGALDEAKRLAESAVAAAPGWADPYFTILSVAMVRGDAAGMRQCAGSLLERGGFPSPLLDFAHNLLVSAEPGGIVLTNGDNDTYPLLALQLARGLRPDVRVVNLSLLNMEAYAKNVWKGADPPPWTEEELTRRFVAWREGKVEKEVAGLVFSQVLVVDLRDRIRAGTWKTPVYFAITVMPSMTDLAGNGLELEGMLLRFSTTVRAVPAGEEPEFGVDAAKTLRLFRETLRLDSATDLAYAWGPTSSVGRLMENYPAVLQRTGAALAAGGDLDGAGYAFRSAIAMIEFHGQTQKATAFREYWKKLDPSAK